VREWEHISHVISLGALRVNMANNWQNVDVARNWREAENVAPCFRYALCDPCTLPMVYYETCMGRTNGSVQSTNLTGFANVTKGPSIDSVNPVLFVGLDRKVLEKTFKSVSLLTDEAFDKQQADPAERSLFIKTIMNDTRYQLPRRWVDRGVFLVTYVQQALAEVNSHVRPRYAYLEVYVATPSAWYIDVDRPLSLNTSNGLRVMYQMFLGCTTALMGYRLAFGARGDKYSLTENLKLEGVDPDPLEDQAAE